MNQQKRTKDEKENKIEKLFSSSNQNEAKKEEAKNKNKKLLFKPILKKLLKLKVRKMTGVQFPLS
jgi:hypothetical protein